MINIPEDPDRKSEKVPTLNKSEAYKLFRQFFYQLYENIDILGLVSYTASSGSIVFAIPGTETTITIETLPLTSIALGDVTYVNATPAWVRLAGNTTTTKKYLSQTGTGAVSAAPEWAQVAQADISGLTTSDGPTFDHLHITNNAAVGTLTVATFGVTVEAASALNQDLTTDAGPQFDHIHTDQLVEVTTDHGIDADGWHIKDGGAGTITGGTNTFNITNGTASLDVAAGAAVNIDKGLTVDGQATTITGAGQANTITLNEGLTIGDGYSGTLTFSAESKTLTVEDTSVVNQDLSSDASPTFNQGNFTTLHTTTILADHIGEHTGSHGVVIDNALTLSTDLAVTEGGTGASTLTDHGVLVGSGTAAITALTVGTNGQVLVGSTGADPVFATITDGEGIDTTLGAGTLTIACETTTTTNAGVIELATKAEVLAGTDTSRAVVPVDLWAKTAIDVNPKAFAQGINMTYAASGSSGITVADNDNIDFGTGNFTLVWKGSLPDWTPASGQNLFYKYQDSDHQWWFYVNGGGNGLGLYLRGAGTALYNGTCGTPLTIIDGTEHQVAVVVVRETASVAGSVTYYVDGVAFGSAGSITAAAPITLSNSGALYVSGSGSTRTASVNKSSMMYNRALSAAEVLSLYQSGIADADKWGSQTAVYTSDFSAGSDGWVNEYNTPVTGNIDGVSDGSVSKDDCLRAVPNTTNGFHIVARNNTLTIGKRYKITYSYYIPAANSNVDGFIISSMSGTLVDRTSTSATPATLGAWTTETVYTTATATDARLRIYLYDGNASQFQDAGGDDLFYTTVFSATQIGATLALEPEGIQPTPGQWLDSSTNKLHALQPVAGASLTRRMQTFEIRWTNTWSATHEAQYIGGAHQAVLPSNCYITDIIGVVSGATIEDIIIGDGSDDNRWVEATTGLAAGTTAFTIANRISDGTNYEMVVDPDANFTGSIAFTIRGIILQ